MFHVIIQARMGSTRLPGKALKTHKKISPLDILISRLEKIEDISKIIIATTKQPKDDIFKEFCKKKKIELFRGDSDNVLKRYYFAAKKFESENIIRLTSDCPFVDTFTLKKMMKIQTKKKYDYLANTYPLPCSYPDGSDIEIFTIKTLTKTFKSAFLPSEKEHVTKYMWSSKKFNTSQLKLKKSLSKYRYTIDIKEDFKLFSFIIDSFPKKKFLTVDMNEIINLIKNNPSKVFYQKNLKRNFGWQKSLKRDKKYLYV
tara:strand:+ start:12232 stop:13002 length:771 start_codon:yes stop_codon:yes gene_type:complete